MTTRPARTQNSDWRHPGMPLGIVAALYVVALVGMADVAGFSAIQRRLEHADWWWLVPSALAVVVAFCAYFFAYRGIPLTNRGGTLGAPSMRAVVATGFGGFRLSGGTDVDRLATRAAGGGAREARVRVTAIAGFEHGVLATIVCPAAILALAIGVVVPRHDFSWPWAVIPPVGFLLAICLAERWRERLRGRAGWRGRAAVFLDAVHLVFELLRRPRRYGYAVLAMLLYWVADLVALWCAIAAFGFHMTALAVIVATGTGLLFTRRTAPLGGAGIMLVALAPTLWYGAGVPLASAVLGVAAYRFFTLFGPVPAALGSLPRVRALAPQSSR